MKSSFVSRLTPAALLCTTLLMSCGEAGEAITNAISSGNNTVAAVEVSEGTGSQSSGSQTSSTGFPAKVKKIVIEANKTFEVKGNLNEGEIISDLSWADRSSTACFPGTQFSKFKANHVLYHTALPPRSILNVKLIPDNPEGPAMSLYAYQIGTTNYSVVPNLGSAVSCEADHIRDRPVRGKVEDGTRSVSLNATTNPYTVVIGVTGVEGATGGYTIQLELEQ